MKITCQKNELANALQIVSKAVANKPQTPILSGIYLKAANGILELQATNYEIGLVARIEAEVTEEGEIAFKAFDGREFCGIHGEQGEFCLVRFNQDNIGIAIE